MNQQIERAIEILKNGGIVIFPTDTAFAVGCRIDDKEAVKRLFNIRKRPQSQATPVLVDTVKMAQSYLESIPKDVVDKLIEPYWPGALTIILPCKTDKVPNLVRGGGSTLGVRIPNHPVARSIIRNLGIPVLGPSANFHGGKTPFKFEDLDPEFVKLVDYVVPGECSICQPSTVIDCSAESWRIIREGAIISQNSNLKAQNHSSKLKTKRTLLIDTSSNEKITVGLRIGVEEKKLVRRIGKEKAQVVLPMIDKILKQHKISLKDLTGIEVNTGSGSFTGLRVGISVANALGFALGIPINGKKAGELAGPKYDFS